MFKGIKEQKIIKGVIYMFGLIPFGSRSVDNYFDDFERAFFRGFEPAKSSCKVDIIDKGDKYILKADLPGYEKNDVNISVDNNILTISASKNESHEDKNENYICKERHSMSVSRSFNVDGIDISKLDAKGRICIWKGYIGFPSNKVGIHLFL